MKALAIGDGGLLSRPHIQRPQVEPGASIANGNAQHQEIAQTIQDTLIGGGNTIELAAIAHDLLFLRERIQ